MQQVVGNRSTGSADVGIYDSTTTLHDDIKPVRAYNNAADAMSDPGDSDHERDDIVKVETFIANARESGAQSVLAKKVGENTIPTVEPDDLYDVEFIVDGGADLDVLNLKTGPDRIKDFIRRLTTQLDIETAGGSTKANKGARVRVAWWDVPGDFLLLKDSPKLLSVGERCHLLYDVCLGQRQDLCLLY
jgi:hypothetical protein